MFQIWISGSIQDSPVATKYSKIKKHYSKDEQSGMIFWKYVLGRISIFY